MKSSNNQGIENEKNHKKQVNAKGDGGKKMSETEVKVKLKIRDKLAFRALMFMLCIILFIGTLGGSLMIVKAFNEIDPVESVNDLLGGTTYEKSWEFQRQFFNSYYKLDSLRYYLVDKESDREIQSQKERLDKVEGFTYFISTGDYTETNMKNVTTQTDLKKVNKKYFTSKPAYFIYENGNVTKYPQYESVNDWYSSDEYLEEMALSDDSEMSGDIQIYFSFANEFIEEHKAEYLESREVLTIWAPVTVVMGLLTLVIFIWLAVTTGRNRKIYVIDRIWTEIQLAVIAMCLIFGGVGYVAAMEHIQGLMYVPIIELILLGSIGLVLAGIGLWFVLAIIRLLKHRQFWKSAICGKFVIWIYSICNRVFQGSSLMKKIVLVALAICLLSATVFLAPVVFVAIIAFAPKFIKQYEAVKNGVIEVKNGNLQYKIPITGNGELDNLAKDINEISSATNIAVQNELKNQRLKTDLISNVSHDLKNPLTSMVTYIDLLKKEGLDSENAAKYLEILDQKTNRLSKLTEDLFEAAKASSGTMPVRMEKVEMLSLINQGLGEMDEKIKASGLEFIISANKDKYYVWADGQLLWRVMENLMTNVLKYAQENSRVYINLREPTNGKEDNMNMESSSNCKHEKGRGIVVFEIKNISKQALNIEADELMERFKRGDEARTTEGSGLGLAIAKDLVKLQNGWLEITIDGDLFKAQVMLEKHNNPE